MEIITATNDTIKNIVKSEIERLGLNADLNHINTSNVTSMSYMFDTSQFNGDISKWDTSNVTDMYYMFYNSNFNGDISKWNTKNVTNMNSIFYDSKFNGDVSNWNTSNVTYYADIFKCTNRTCKFKDEYYIEGKLVSSNEYKLYILGIMKRVLK